MKECIQTEWTAISSEKERERAHATRVKLQTKKVIVTGTVEKRRK
jgi:hypothetical protein